MPTTKQKPEEWSTRNKAVVRMVYGMLVGGGIIVGAFVFGGHVLEDGNLTMIEAAFVGALAMSGFVAAMPWVFMSLLHELIGAWQNRKSP